MQVAERSERLPSLVAFILCKRIEFHGNGTRTFHGAFDRLGSSRFPVIINAHAHVRLADVSASAVMTLELISAQTLEEVAPSQEFAVEPQAGDYILDLIPIGIEIPFTGRFFLQLRVGDQIIGQHPLRAVKKTQLRKPGGVAGSVGARETVPTDGPAVP
jgi:hypothetical protein